MATAVTLTTGLTQQTNVKKMKTNKQVENASRDVNLNHTHEPWMNHYDYTSVINGLKSNSTKTKIKILDELLTSQIIDTKQNLWGELSQNLRKCFVSASNEIFLKTLKIHHRIIAFPNTCCEGYLNLLKSTLLLLSSRYFNDVNKSRILLTLQLILSAQNCVMKLLLHASRTIVDDIVSAFVSVITFKSVFDYFGVLDPKSLWLNYFCYGAYIRHAFFNNLKDKHPDFIKFVVMTFTKKMSINENHSPYGDFLLHFWQYSTNLKFLSAESTLQTIITNLQNQKKPELATLLIDFFSLNPFLLTPKLLDILTEPLVTLPHDNIQSFVDSNNYIFIIITNLTSSANSKIIFGLSATTRKGRSRQMTRNCINIPQKITEITILSVTNGETIPLLLSCCFDVYKSHPLSLTHGNPPKFFGTLADYYRSNWKNDVNTRATVLPIFEFFFAWYGPTFDTLTDNNEILVDVMTFAQSGDFKTILSRLGRDTSGFEFIKNHRKNIVRSYLDQIWASEDVDDDSHLINFFLFLFVVKMNTRSVVALLSDDDDDSTVVESDDRSASLADLIEKTLNEPSDPDEEYLGLMTMKVFIMNLDLLLYLQANHQMQEKLAGGDEEEIIDAQSSLRRNILVNLEIIGFANDAEFQVTELQSLPKFFEIFQSDSDNDLRKFLENGNYTESNWMAQAALAFKNSFVFDPALLSVLLEQKPKTCVYRKIELHWPPPDSVYYQLHPEDFCGISLIIGFGQKSGLLQLSEDRSHNDNLTLLIRQSRAFIGHQPANFINFDWFVGVTYLMCLGDFDQCKSILINSIHSQATSIIWTTFGQEFDKTLQQNFYLQLDVLLEENCSCFQALKMLGIAPEVLVRSWLTQLFFHNLKFEEIYNFLVFSVVYPVESLLYYMVAIFCHLNDNICRLTHSLSLESILKMTQLSNFKLTDYMPLIENLSKRYRNNNKLQ